MEVSYLSPILMIADMIGRIMATRIMGTLERLCKVVLDSDLAPRINIQLFIDVKETVEDLRKVANECPAWKES